MPDFLLPDYTPIYPITKTVQPRQRRARLPEWGTEQRATVGQNQTSPSWSIKWILSPTQANTLDEFLAERAKNGQWFLWTPPNDTEGRYRCDSWTKEVATPSWWQFQATFRQVYSYEEALAYLAALEAGVFIATLGQVFSFKVSLDDPYAEYVSLLLHMDGANASTVFSDNSYNSLAVVPGGSAQVSTTQVKYGTGSGIFNGTNSVLTVAPASAFNFGTGDFTVELWAYQSATPDGGALISEEFTGAGDTVEFTIGFCNGTPFSVGGSRLFFGFYDGTSFPGIAAASALANNQWHHIAAVRFGNTCSLYINGVSVGAFTNKVAVSRDERVFIGRRWDTTAPVSFFNGYIDDVRVTKGVARYTANFTPPAGAFLNPAVATIDPNADSVSLLLHMNGANGSTTFVDSSYNDFNIIAAGNAQLSETRQKFGPTSCAFDGSGDYLDLPASSAFAMGTSAFTVETWIYISSYHPSTGYALFDTIPNGGVGNRTNAMVWIIMPSGKLDVFSNGAFRGLSTSTVPLNQWNHLALVRSGTTWQYYINGVRDTTQYTYSVDLSLATGCQIGKVGDGFDYFLNGYLDDFRITKGVARYTANFTLPSVPFPSPQADPYAASVSLLLRMNGANASTTFTDSSPNALTITPGGNAQISTAQSKFGGASGLFDGTGDFLASGTPSALAFGTGDFTVEAWSYLTASLLFYPEIMTISYGSTSFTLRYGDSGFGYRLQASLVSTVVNSVFSANLTQSTHLNTWVHIAFTRSSGVCRLFVNGVRQNLAAGTSTSYTLESFTGTENITGLVNSNMGVNFQGYIDDLRVTKGVARYVTNFTPPTAQFPLPVVTTADPYRALTSMLLHMNGTNGSTTFTDSSIVGYAVTRNGNAQISTAQSKFGGASGLFDGTGDFLSVPYFVAHDLIGSVFTIETWLYPTALKNETRICALGGGAVIFNGTNGVHLIFQLNNTGKLIFQWWNGSAGATATTTASVSINTWTHVAVCVSGSTIYLSINGTVQTFTSNTLVRPSTNPLFNIGTIPGEAGGNITAFVGYMDDFRVTKGIARYQANFTPPTAAFPDA